MTFAKCTPSRLALIHFFFSFFGTENGRIPLQIIWAQIRWKFGSILYVGMNRMYNMRAKANLKLRWANAWPCMNRTPDTIRMYEWLNCG